MNPTDSVTLSTTTKEVVPENSHRRKITFVNTDASAIISISQGGHAFNNKGIVLFPRGSFTDNRDNQGYIWKGSYSAIADAGTPVLSIQEES